MINIKSIVFLILLYDVSFSSDITGIVFDSFSKKKIPECIVEICENRLWQKTDENGVFRFDNMKEGSYNLIFKHQSYEFYKRNDVYVSGKRSTHLIIELNSAISNLENITITAKTVKKNPEMVTSTGIFLNSELMRAPGALADVQRIVQNLPGVVSGADNVNEVIVRGGMRNENLFLIDNIEVVNPNHFADQNSGGGVLSILNPLLVQKLVFNAGAPPSTYGGKASSVIDVTLRDGNNEQIFGGIDLGVTGAGFHIEGPAWKNSNFIFSANKSYLDLVSKFDPGTAVPKYWAAQGKITQSFKNSKLSLLTLYGDSDIEIKDGKESRGLNTDIIISGSSNFIAGFNWDRKFGDRVNSRLTFSNVDSKFNSLGYDEKNGSKDTVFFNETDLKEFTLKIESEFLFNDFFKIQSGLYGKINDFEMERKNENDTLYIYQNELKIPVIDQNGNHICTINSKNKLSGKSGGAFISSSLLLDPGIRLITGLRTGYLRNTRETVIDPRIGVSYILNNKLTLNSSFGIQNQFPDYSELVTESTNRRLKAKRAVTGVWGIDYSPGLAGISLIIETFYKRYNNLSLNYLYDVSDKQLNFLKSNQKNHPGEGKSYGVELFSEKKLTDNFSFSLAYSHSRSYWKYVALKSSDWFRSDYDYRNVFTFTGAYKFELTERAWYNDFKQKIIFKLLLPILPFADRQEFSTRFRFRGGRPYTPYFYDTNFKRWCYNQNQLNSTVMEPYHRLDLRWERRYSYGIVNAIFYFEVQNLYNRKNIWTYLYDDNKDRPSKIYQLPVFPSGGFIIGF